MANMKTLWYKFSNEELLKFFLRKDVEYVYSSRLIQTRNDKSLLLPWGKIQCREFQGQ